MLWKGQGPRPGWLRELAGETGACTGQGKACEAAELGLTCTPYCSPSGGLKPTAQTGPSQRLPKGSMVRPCRGWGCPSFLGLNNPLAPLPAGLRPRAHLKNSNSQLPGSSGVQRGAFSQVPVTWARCTPAHMSPHAGGARQLTRPPRKGPGRQYMGTVSSTCPPSSPLPYPQVSNS